MMQAQLIEPAMLAPTALIEAKALLRLETVDEEALLAAQLRTALELAEDFTGSVWLEASYRETRSLCREMILQKRPVQRLTGLRVSYANGSDVALDPTLQIMQISDHGEAMLTIANSVLEGDKIIISYQAGAYTDWTYLPEGLRMGILRMAAHLFTWRDDSMSIGVPGAVAALWHPYKKLRLM
jgi:uncharacterized phiE125 gp8 family phage protein